MALSVMTEKVLISELGQYECNHYVRVWRGTATVEVMRLCSGRMTIASLVKELSLPEIGLV
jgi:hypothetical protein